MDNNASYEVVKKEVQKKIINYLFVNGDINVNEYETLLSKIDERINKLNGQIEKEHDKYINLLKVDIGI